MRLLERIEASGQEAATTIITVEEQLRGWLAEIHRLSDPHAQMLAYERLQQRIDFFASWTVLPWNSDAVDRFVHFRREGVRIGSMDLKIACITLAHGATLLTRNTIDSPRCPSCHARIGWCDQQRTTPAPRPGFAEPREFTPEVLLRAIRDASLEFTFPARNLDDRGRFHGCVDTSIIVNMFKQPSGAGQEWGRV